MPDSVNADGCLLWEESTPPTNSFHAESVLLHELGHCAMALDHIDRNWDVDNDGIFELTSFTRSWGAGPLGVQAGPDGIRGSLDDTHIAPGGGFAQSVAWFRKSDNNPLIVDGTVIDTNTYSRSVAANLPPDNWAASGNRAVSESLGFVDTQAVMYSRTATEQEYYGLSADEVNMVEMGMTGQDLMVGGGDDYTIELIFVADCMDPFDILVLFDALPGGVAAQCQTPLIDYDVVPPPNPLLHKHFEIITASPIEPLFIVLNQALTWNTDPPGSIFTDDFESGDTLGWSSAVP